MRRSFLQLAFMCTTLAMLTLSACKSGPKDADIEKAITEKAAAISGDATGVSASVKDGVATINGTFKDEASRSGFETTVKAVPGVKSVVNNTTVAPPPPAPSPVTIAADDPLTKGVTDATKDFPGVKAEVNDGVVTLTGEMKRSSLPKLMQTLHSLNPKKINNQLTLK